MIIERFPRTPAADHLHLDSGGYLYIDPATFPDDFARDVPGSRRK